MIAGPLAATHRADFGAEVVKIGAVEAIFPAVTSGVVLPIFVFAEAAAQQSAM